MFIRRFVYLFLALCFTVNTLFAIDEDELFSLKADIKKGSILSVADCVSTAFKNSPKIKRQKYNLDIARSNVGLARSAYFPVLSAGAGFYNENNSNDIYYDRTYRNLPSVGVSVNKMVWDFGKTTALIKMEDFYKIGAEYEFMDSICAALFDTKAKYYKLLKALALEKIAKQDVEINERFVQSAHDTPDKETANVNLSDAKLQFIKAQNNVKNAKLDLNNSMYLEKFVDFNVQNTKTFSLKPDFTENFQETEFIPEKFNFSEDNAVDLAYKNSPDLQVLINTQKAMEQSLAYIKRTYLPELNAGVGYGFNNNNIADTNSSLQINVNLSSNINLMELKHSLKKANAEINLAENEISLFKKDLLFEVKRALNNTNKAERQIPLANETAKQAYDTLKTVEAKYKSKSIDYIALQDARKDYISALSEYVESLYDYNMALIQTEMAMHYHITDIHHKSEHAVHYHSDDLIKHLTEALNCDEKEEHKHKSKREKL